MVSSTRSRGSSAGPEVLWHLAELNLGEESRQRWPNEVAAILPAIMPGTEAGHYMSHMSAHLAPAALGIRKKHHHHVAAASWVVTGKRTISNLAAAAEAQVGAVTPNNNRSSGAAQAEQLLICYTRRNVIRPPLDPVATRESVNCEEFNCEEPIYEELNCKETNGEEPNCEPEALNCELAAICEVPNCESQAKCEPEVVKCEPESTCEETNGERAPSCKSSPKLRGQRSSRKRREIPLSASFLPNFSGIPGDGDNVGHDAAAASEAEAPAEADQAGGAAVVGGRPRRQAKRKLDKNYVRSDSSFFDWTTAYPGEPCPLDYRDVPQLLLGDVETISDHGCSDSVVSDHAPMSFKSQIDTQPTRKARRLLVEEPRLDPPHGDESAMCPHTPEMLQESRDGECPIDAGHGPGCTSSWASLDPDSYMEEDSVPVVTTTNHHRETRKKVKKHTRPKVKRPPNVKVAKAPKIPKTSSKRKSSEESGSRVEGKSSRAKKGAAAAAPREVLQSNYAASAPPSTLVVAAPHMEDHPGFANMCVDLCGWGSEMAAVPGDPPSTPRGNTLTVPAPFPSFSDQSPFGSYGDDSATDSDVERGVERGPTTTTLRRKRSQRTRRALLVDVDTVPSNIPFFRMTDAQQRQRAWALSQAYPRLCEDPMGLVQALISETPQHLVPLVKARTDKLVFDIIIDRELAPGLRLAGDEPRLAMQLEPLLVGEQSRLAIQSEEPRLLVGEEPRSAIQPEEPLLVGEEPRSAIQREEPLLVGEEPRSAIQPEEPLLVGEEPRSAILRKDPLLVGEEPRLAVHEWEEPRLAIQSGELDPMQSRPETTTEDQEQLQLVVYGQKASTREMVVYQAARSTKLKYKPKVVLDSTTIHTFDRLRLQGGEAMDADRSDEDWVEARMLWSDRAHRFNSIMRQVQGDRTFSKWRGSLLDSVVGVFLTQNVSDFLSSNAFMELRAHFPPHSRAREQQCSDVTVGGCPAGTSSDTDSVGAAAGIESVVSEEASIAPVQGSAVQLARDQSDQSGSNPCRLSDEERSVTSDSGTASKAVHIESCCAGAGALDERNECRTLLELAVAPEEEAGAAEEVAGDQAVLIEESCCAGGAAAPDEPTILESDVAPEEAAQGTGDQALHIEESCCAGGATAPDEPGTMLESGNVAPEEAAQEIGDQKMQLIEELPCRAGGAASPDEPGTKLSESDTVVPEAGANTHVSPEPVDVLEEKFQSFLSSDGTWTPHGREGSLAATLRTVLGKRTTGREVAAKDAQTQLRPLGMAKWRVPRNKRRAVAVARLKPKMKWLTGAERSNYELRFNYRLNSAQWAPVRADALSRMESCERDPFTVDSVDWEAVRRADVAEVASVIKERGMHNVLGGRIKSLLERIHHDQDGRLDLEWIRKLSPINAENFLSSVRGLGLKSVECIRLLTLHHPSFPVDTNVGRIVVRLGWVPLEPLPEETQLHLLETYPVQEQIQKYMWPRLCTLDQQTLYEFHYQLITFGKVFCTKSKPNCNACPMRSQCKHYESAYCRPLLQGPEYETSNNSEIVSMQPRQSSALVMLGDQAPCIPIIDEPNSPEYTTVHDIEDTPFIDNAEIISCLDLDPDLSPNSSCSLSLYDADKRSMVFVDLNEMPTQDMSEELPCTVRETETVFVKDVVVEEPEAIPQTSVALQLPPSQELVLVPQAFPAPQLKNVQRLRTIHYVYELPDHHPLLAKMDKRDPDDPCFYLLAIWNPDEVPEMMPKIGDDDARNPYACAQPNEEAAAAAAVRGTLLVPCRTAMRGSFPLNGTYFQVNEVFADHASSIVPIDVPRTSLWDLRRRFVYFGTSVTSIFKGMSQDEIQCCFKKGYVCVRAMDHRTRQPKLLAARLHQSGAKIVAAAKRGRRRPGPTKTT